MKIKNFKLKQMSRNQWILVLFVFLILAFFVSFISVLVVSNKKKNLVLFFPHAKIENELVCRPRYAVRRKGREQEVAELIRQLGLGPNQELRDRCYAIFPLGMEARAIIEKKGELFVELPMDFILNESKMGYTIDRSIEILEYNLKHNFNWISSIIVTVDGVKLLDWSIKSYEKDGSEGVNEDSEPEEEKR